MDTVVMSPAATERDDESCWRCGEPLPLDRECDCAGTDRDASQPENHPSFRRMKTCTRYGFARTYPDPALR